jgi:hypothetical protein
MAARTPPGRYQLDSAAAGHQLPADSGAAARAAEHRPALLQAAAPQVPIAPAELDETIVT